MNRSGALWFVGCRCPKNNSPEKTNLYHKRKIQILNAYVTSKVMYALDLLWLLKADNTRLDAFQYMCLRKYINIAHSCISRISNAEVYERSGQLRYSSLLESVQKRLFQRIQMMPVNTA